MLDPDKYDSLQQRLQEQIDFCEEVQRLLKSVRILENGYQIQSILIACLVELRGGDIPGEVWHRCNSIANFSVGTRYDSGRDVVTIKVTPAPSTP